MLERAEAESMSSPPTKQLCVFVTFHVQPDKVEAWKAVHRQVWTPVGNEKECLMFDVFVSQEEPGLIRLVEIWDGDREWFENVGADGDCKPGGRLADYVVCRSR
jgi:hypothetical protein